MNGALKMGLANCLEHRNKSSIQILDVFHAYQDDLHQVEECIHDHTTSEVELIPKVAHYLIDSGGKRLRPLLLLISSHICGYHGKQRFPLAAALEFIHTSTLLHDDVIDEATIRRCRTSANRLFGNTISVLVGDFLSLKSFHMLAEARNLDILQYISRIGYTMAEGEVFQLIKRGEIDLTEEEYLTVIEKKTAILISAACTIGAYLGQASKEKNQALSLFGKNIGMAFQITDDILDFTGEEQKFGKSICKDLEDGKLTLPLIFALRQSTQKEKNEIKKIIKGLGRPEEIARISVGLINKYQGIDYALETAIRYINGAHSQLSVFHDCPQKDHLHAVAEYVLYRNR